LFKLHRETRKSLVVFKGQIAVAKQKVEEIISTRIREKAYVFARYQMYQNSFCFEIQLWFMLTIICSEVKHRYEYTRTLNILNMRPQGCQAQEHRCRQLLQLVVVEMQSAVSKQKAEKIISTRKEDRIYFCKVSDVHQNSLCSEIQLCFMLTITCSEVKRRYEDTRTSKVLNVRPQGCQAREHRCRQLLQLVVIEIQIAVAKQKGEKIISTGMHKFHCI
jgi:hypothetical protein